jgi:solute carrier family 25 (mitochondrial folate transporter), member 32
MTAGACSTFATNPLWVIKTRFMVGPFHRLATTFLELTSRQTQSPDEIRYRHTLDAALRIYRSEGWRAFYRGLFPSLLGISHVTVQFPLYEQLKIIARKPCLPPYPLYARSPPALLPDGGSDEPLSSQAILVCSGTAKMVASVATYPHEVIRTRLQIHRRELAKPGAVQDLRTPGVIRTATDVVTKEGWRGLYRGLSINLIRTVPNSAVTLLT